MNSDTRTRRQALAAVGGAGAMAVMGGAVLGGCSTGDGSSRDDSGRNSAVKLPTFTAFDGVKPAEPATPDGVVQALFLQYPERPPTISTGKPSSGGEASVMISLDSAVPPPRMDRNDFWKALNDRLGMTLNVQQTPSAQYGDKIAVTLAGGDLPDLMHIRLADAPQRLPDVLNAKFANLTEHLSGDSIQNYPALAAIPTSAWKGAVFNGGIYGVARTLPLALRFLYMRSDLIAEIGGETTIENGEQLLELCKAVTNPSKNRWAMGNVMATLTMIANMNGAPNFWKEENGEFTHIYETEALTKALETVSKMWKDGLFYPDAFAELNPRVWFGAGRTVLDVIGSDPVLMQREFSVSSPGYELTRIVPPKWDGGGLAPFPLNNPMSGLTVINKEASPSRVKELLRVLDYLAAPFGTEEYLFVTYGIADRDYTLEGSNPVLTETGRKEVNPLQLGNIARPTPVNYAADYSDIIRKSFELQQKVQDVAIFDASVGLYSATSQENSVQLDKMITEIQRNIIQGRQPLSTWNDAVKQWRSSRGDKIRDELKKVREDQAN